MRRGALGSLVTAVSAVEERTSASALGSLGATVFLAL